MALVALASPPWPDKLTIKDHIIPNRAKTPLRSVRANFNEQTITVYQAYPSSIADAAVKTQNLASSPEFSLKRTTWIKPSWNWMMYRCGFSYKDKNQERVLAISVSHAFFAELLAKATLAHDGGKEVIIQWDPERTVTGKKVQDVRSIQIGIKPSMVKRWIDEGISSIVDVTSKAIDLKYMTQELSSECTDWEVEVARLAKMGLVPVERCYDRMIDAETRKRLGMEVDQHKGEEGKED